MNQRAGDWLSESPMPPIVLIQINKIIPKRVRRNGDSIKS